jgi:hypothetical protein
VRLELPSTEAGRALRRFAKKAREDLVRTGIGQEDRPEGSFLGSGGKLPQIVGQDVGQSTLKARLFWPARFGLLSMVEEFSLHGS